MLRQCHPCALRSRATFRCVGSVNAKTLADRLGEAGRCTPDEGLRRLFHRSLYAHARPLARVVGWIWPAHFEPDRELVAQVARARSLGEVDEELRIFTDSMRNREWWRRHGRLRVSRRRLRREARRIFAGGAVR